MNVHTRFLDEIKKLNKEYEDHLSRLDEWRRTEINTLTQKRVLWVEGWDAFERGEALSSNPYHRDPKKMIANYNWKEGWEMANIEHIDFAHRKGRENIPDDCR